MATKLFCDRCGAEINPMSSVTRIGMWRFKMEANNNDYKLCVSCAHKLRARLIETLKNWHDAHADVDDVEGCRLIKDVMWEIIEQASADVAPVVRRKDCKYSYEDIDGLTCVYGPCVDCTVPEDFYCKYGERNTET